MTCSFARSTTDFCAMTLLLSKKIPVANASRRPRPESFRAVLGDPTDGAVRRSTSGPPNPRGRPFYPITHKDELARPEAPCLVSVIHSVRVPLLARAVAVDPVEPSRRELDVPVIARSGSGGPPALFQVPRAGGDPDGAGDLGLGAVGGLKGSRAKSSGSLAEPALSEVEGLGMTVFDRHLHRRPQDADREQAAARARRAALERRRRRRIVGDREALGDVAVDRAR